MAGPWVGQGWGVSATQAKDGPTDQSQSRHAFSGYDRLKRKTRSPAERLGWARRHLLAGRACWTVDCWRNCYGHSRPRLGIESWLNMERKHEEQVSSSPVQSWLVLSPPRKSRPRSAVRVSSVEEGIGLLESDSLIVQRLSSSSHLRLGAAAGIIMVASSIGP